MAKVSPVASIKIWKSRAFIALVGVFALVCVLSFWVVRSATQNAIEHQAQASEITDVTLFFVAVLIACFGYILRQIWLLAKQDKELQDQEAHLSSLEQDAEKAKGRLKTHQAMQEAFAELTTYMQAIDQHALVSASDRTGRIIYANAKFSEVSGYRLDELIGQDHRIVNSRTHGAAFFEQMWETISKGKVWRDIICNRAKSGKLYWVDSAIVPMKDAKGEVDRYISIRIDISEQQRHEDTLNYQATHDALTDLPNRLLLLDRVAQAINMAKRDPKLIVLFFIDLDKFKHVNDTLGHGAGDEVLCEMARRLKALARECDTVARLGGDEFVVACNGIERGNIDALGERIRAALNAPVNLFGDLVTLGGSVGVAIYPDHAQDIGPLIQCADIAMYEAKSQGGSAVCHFSTEMQKAIDVRAEMEGRLRDRIARELILYYQPQADFNSGALVSLEALVRWNSPEYGFLPPVRFIPLAEESNLISLIDNFVLDAVCSQMAKWQRQGFGWIRVAVNLAATKFSDPDFQLEIQRCLDTYGIPPGFLELEVTESLSMRDPKVVLKLMHQLKAMGVLLAIDDFGTGYSNLGYLKSFPADRLKVDQSFVRGLMKNPKDRAIVASVIMLAHSMNMRAIAEGVETEEEAILLYSLNVDEVQGYLIGHPQPAELVEKLFTQTTLIDPRMFMRPNESPVVLVVEDDETSMEIMVHMLTSFGLSTVSAASTEQARELFHKYDFTLAIVDNGLPGESGIKLLSELKKMMPKTVRVLVTASNDPQVIRDAINIGGVSHFVNKPIDPDVLKKIAMQACWSAMSDRSSWSDSALTAL